jgi:cystathionine beta-lyase/cystathionine gamma-synthase
VLARYGLRFDSADLRDPGALEDAITDRTRMVWLESPTNPLLRLADIAAVAGIARGHGALTVVDNTFATPVLQNPLALGADAVVHSSTKYLGGHSDVVGGAVMLDDDALAESLRFHQNAVGAVPSPFDCWLLLRGVKTLALRVREQCASARTIAEWLSAHPAVQVVHYPGLPSHPQHALALRQMGAGGGMVSFEVASEERALEVLSRLRVVLLAESLGAVESLAEHPPRMTHASIPAEQRRRVGIGDGLIRLSVGVEDVADLLADLDRALD